jgi:hypothetical protein
MKRLICLLMITAAMSSCVHVYYAPNTPNAPLLSEKGETRINALYSAGGYTNYTGVRCSLPMPLVKTSGSWQMLFS